MKLVSVFLALMLVPSAAFAQTAQITILTDKQSYTTDDTISISGTISSLGTSNSAVLQVYDPFNVLVQIGTIPVASDGTFHYTIKAEGKSWSNDGTYTIKIIYVSTPILATATANVVFKTTQAQSSQTVTAQPSQSSSITTPQSSQPQTSSNNTTVVRPSDIQTPIEEQIQQRIALANKLKQQLDQSATKDIPFWVKDTARKWHDGTVDNLGYAKDIQYFISSGLVKTNAQATPDSFVHVPSWQKEVAGYWSQGLISDYDYVNSIQFLLDEKIIR